VNCVSILKYNKKPFIFVGALLLFVGMLLVVLLYLNLPGKFFAFLSPTLNKKHVVELRQDGFYPEEIIIRQGDTVAFITIAGKSFWPASNIHPAHTIYPEFDPKESISPEDSWSFKFTEPGLWKYHDHIQANHTGKITVLAPTGSGSWDRTQAATSCVGETPGGKLQCWDELLESTLAEHGLPAAFKLFIELYRSEPSVAKGCHGWGHVLGKGAYHLFADNKDVVVPNEASYCGYGFYHGFLEELLLNTGDPKGALDFCNYASERVAARQTIIVYVNCVHGIGHGSTSEAAEDPANWGKVDPVLAYGKKNCELVTNHPQELEICWEGVFNELQQNINFATNGFSYELLKDDFFGICRQEEQKYKRACYFEFIGLITYAAGHDFRKAAAMVLEDVPNEKDASYLMVKLAADFMQNDIVNPTYEKNVLDCRSLPEYVYKACLQGIVLGFTAHGEPGREYVKGLDFCRSPILTEAEEEQCHRKLLRDLSSLYLPEKLAEICQGVEDLYKEYCTQGE